jgi:hypothetical protein
MGKENSKAIQTQEDQREEYNEHKVYLINNNNVLNMNVFQLRHII